MSFRILSASFHSESRVYSLLLLLFAGNNKIMANPKHCLTYESVIMMYLLVQIFKAFREARISFCWTYCFQQRWIDILLYSCSSMESFFLCIYLLERLTSMR